MHKYNATAICKCFSSDLRRTSTTSCVWHDSQNVKSTNLLIVNLNSFIIVIFDFNFSKVVSSNRLLKTFCETTNYVAFKIVLIDNRITVTIIGLRSRKPADIFIYLRLYTNFRFAFFTWSRLTFSLYDAHTKCKIDNFEILIFERKPRFETWENKWKQLCLICLWLNLTDWDCYEKYQKSRKKKEEKVDAEMKIKNEY